jgi:protein O-mannosyl-transferase
MKLPRNSLNRFCHNKWLLAGFIVFITCAVYYNSLRAPFIFDDRVKIERNPDIKQLANIKTRLFYPYRQGSHNFFRNDPSRPVTYLTFTLNYYFGKLDTFGYHLFNILLHILNSLLVFMLARKLILYALKKDSAFFPFVTALLFAVHPVNTEVVTYIYHRSEGLALVFYLASLLLFTAAIGKNRRLYALSLLCFALGLLSKQTSATLPAIVLLFDFVFLSDYDPKKLARRWHLHLPYWLILAGYILFRVFYFGQVGDAETDAYTRWTNYSYLITQPYVILRYIGLLLVPSGLCFDHVVAPAKLYEARTLASLLSMTFAFILMLAAYKRKTPGSKIFLFGSLWFFIALSPTSSFLPISDAMAERRLYVPGFGFCLLLAYFFFELSRRKVFSGPAGRRVMLGLIGIYLIFLGAATVRRNSLYLRPFSMWQDAISKYPANPRAHHSLALLYFEQKEYGKAVREFEKALELQPGAADTHADLGLAYQRQKEYSRAAAEYEKAMELKPDSAETHNNLGVLYKEQKEYEKAAREYEKALEAEPGFVEARGNLGIIYQEQKEYGRAINAYEEALKIQPDYVRALKNLGSVHFALKEYGKTIEEYRKALAIDPGNLEICNNLGLVYIFLKQYDKAAAVYDKTAKLDPRNAETYFNCGYARTHTGEYEKAVENYSRAIALNPGLGAAYYNLACVYALVKNTDKALEYLKTAVEKDGSFRGQAKTDEDFKTLRSNPGFLEIVR